MKFKAKSDILKWSGTTGKEIDGFLVVVRDGLFHWFLEVDSHYELVMTSIKELQDAEV